MRYSLEIRKFIYSQYFFGGLRIALGVSLPAVLMLTVFHNRDLGFTIATGALGACVVDMPGPLKHKQERRSRSYAVREYDYAEFLLCPLGVLLLCV